MLEKILRKVERLIPKKLYKAGQPLYHWLLALLGAVRYNFPARDIRVIGITGTKGKTTTSELVTGVLEAAGFKVALMNGIRFKIGTDVERNKYKMSMPGRFFVQHFLRRAVDAKCDWVVLEMTSEGAKQFRHKWIALDAFIFTNLSPEHIEAHGSFEAYKQAKLSLTESLGATKKETYLIADRDDEATADFLKCGATHKHTFSIEDLRPFKADHGIEIRVDGSTIYSKLHGAFNVKNILAAITFGKAIGLSTAVLKRGIESVEKVPGRAEQIIASPYEVYVDYAHTADSLKALYESFPTQKKICVLGNTGGGRDTWKRPVMAQVADTFCDEIILTDEDPYDEDPASIIEAMRQAIVDTPTRVIMDRRAAINTALRKAKKGYVVLITGKGTDPYIMRAGGKREPWSDAEVVREEFASIAASKVSS
jgi:UDP-N-acetylmuramoyl-L-alanyl-D-glutamate--2,6-diaminopimelate ligase